MKALERRADILFSRFIRERDGGCVMAGEQPRGFPYGCWGDLQCAHLIPRGRYGKIRWEPLNAVALCAGHHGWLDAHPLARTAWATERLGGPTYAALLGQGMHGARPDVRAIVEDLERRLAALASTPQRRKDEPRPYPDGEGGGASLHRRAGASSATRRHGTRRGIGAAGYPADG